MSRTASLTLFTIGVALAFGRVIIGCAPLPHTPAQHTPVVLTTAAPIAQGSAK